MWRLNTGPSGQKMRRCIRRLWLRFVLLVDWISARIPQGENGIDFAISEAAHKARKELGA